MLTLLITNVLQPLSMALLLLIALGLSAAVALAAFGVIAWPELAVSWNGQPVEDAGMWALIGLALLALALCTYLPTNGRVMALERSHRDFRISMQDVAHAYYTAHTADREGMFRMSHEFDAVRERIAFLREHPDLGTLEPEILEAAAQMSQISHQLADTYSEEKVNRARTFLTQRQEELAAFNDRLETAKALTNDMRHWLDAVELEEAVAQSQLDRIKAELDDILPELNLGLALHKDKARPDNIVGLAKPAAE
ncbi:DNA repair protein [Pseudooceanicola sp. LIPI14-2-Ac024]|uniref:DNA repair protein n=1 Tax=Pseudooceanicola sp. LIPI14-2-Ac024 TaxID=3344875 RepID=UPI0035D02E3A